MKAERFRKLLKISFCPSISCVNFNLKKHLTITLKMFIISNVDNQGGDCP